MDAYRAIVTKRDTRDYAPTSIPDDVLGRIIQAGRMAGSSKNGQPVRLVVLRDKDRLVEMAKCGQYTAPVPNAAVAIAVVVLPDNVRGDFDAGRTAQNMMVAGWAEGVTSCPVAIHDQECARATLGLPDGCAVAIVIAMGYPAEGASLHRGQPRVDADEFVHWGRW